MPSCHHSFSQASSFWLSWTRSHARKDKERKRRKEKWTVIMSWWVICQYRSGEKRERERERERETANMREKENVRDATCWQDECIEYRCLSKERKRPGANVSANRSWINHWNESVQKSYLNETSLMWSRTIYSKKLRLVFSFRLFISMFLTAILSEMNSECSIL